MSKCDQCGQDVPTGTPTLKEKIERLNPKIDIPWIEFVKKLKEILLELEAKNGVELEAKNGVTFIPPGIFPSFPTPYVPPTIPYQPQIAVNPRNDPSYYPETCNASKTPVPDGTGFSGDPS